MSVRYYDVLMLCRKMMNDIDDHRHDRMRRMLLATEHYFDDIPVDDGSQSVGIVAWDGDE